MIEPAINPALSRRYDVRGIYPTEVNAQVLESIGRAFAAVIKPKTVAVGMDVRTSGPELKAGLIEGLRKSGVDVVDVGLLSTDMLYFAVANYGYDGGVIVSASHNPAEYNGIKPIKKNAEVLHPDGEFMELKRLAQQNQFTDAPTYGNLSERNILDDYIKKCLSFVDQSKLKPLRIVVNPNFGAVCPLYKKIQESVPFEAIPLNGEVDGTFPKGRPDPLRPETRSETEAVIKKEKPDFGVAWDADGDRVFFYDENGEFVDGYYVLGMMSEYFLNKYPGDKILHEPRQIWAVDDKIATMGGKNLLCRAGHIFLKAEMRRLDCVFGGEMSGHMYFRDFWYCDNGLIPFLIMWQMISEGKKLSEMAKQYREKYFISGEINFTVPDIKQALEAVEKTMHGSYRKEYEDLELGENHQWRANVRPSDNEPLLRLNVEATSQELVDQKVKEISAVIAEAR